MTTHQTPKAKKLKALAQEFKRLHKDDPYSDQLQDLIHKHWNTFAQGLCDSATILNRQAKARRQ